MRGRRDSRRERRAEAARREARARLGAYPWSERLLGLLERIAEGGHRAYLVGGTVRDALLGAPCTTTYDVATDLAPAQVMARFARVAPTGLAHGTVLVLEEADLPAECTTFRREGAYSDARRPDTVEFTRDPLEDLARRDLTVNAMAFDPRGAELLDPHGGALDLSERVLRAVGEPIERFREDALRPLRAARLAVTLEMEPDPGLAGALEAVVRPGSGVRVEAVALERVRDELQKMLAGRLPSRGLGLLDSAGLMDLWLPELARCRGVRQNRFHAHDVLTHSLRTCDAAPRDRPTVRWAALLHDVGKPDTRVDRDGEGTFYDHAQVGAALAERLLTRLRVPAADRAVIVHLVREHMVDYRSAWTDSALRRWLRRVGPESVEDLFALRVADMRGRGKPCERRGVLEEMRARIDRLVEASHALQVADLAVDGHDVMRIFETPPGPAVGAALAALLEEVLDHPERNVRDYLLDRLREHRSSRARGA